MWGVRGRALSHPRPLVRSGVHPGPTTHWLWVRGVRAWGPVTNPTARALACYGGGMRVPGGGASCLGVGRPGTGALQPPTSRLFGRAAGAHYPLAVGAGGAGVGTRLQRHSARSCVLWGGMRVPGGGASCLGVGRPESGALPPPTTRPFGRAAGARFPLAVGAVCGLGGPAVLGTLSRAAVRHVLCALPGFAAPGGRSGLAPVLVPWLWPAACLSGVPHGPALVRRSSSGPVALGAPVGFPVAVVPSPTPGAVAPGFTGWLRGARGGRPRTGLIVPAAGPCRGKGAGRAPRRTRSGPQDGVVPGGSLRLPSWAACAAVVLRVWTRSLKRPVSRTVRLATGDSAGWKEQALNVFVLRWWSSKDVITNQRFLLRSNRSCLAEGHVAVQFYLRVMDKFSGLNPIVQIDSRSIMPFLNLCGCRCSALLCSATIFFFFFGGGD